MTVLAIEVGSLLVVFNGAFVALEFGLLGAMKSAIDAEATAGRKSALAAQRLQRDVLTTLGRPTRHHHLFTCDWSTSRAGCGFGNRTTGQRVRRNK